MIEQDSHIFNRRSSKLSSFPGALKKQKPSHGIRLSIDNLKLPSIRPLISTKRVPHHYQKFVKQTMQNLKTDKSLYKGTVKLHLQDFKELTSYSKKQSKNTKLPNNVMREIKLIPINKPKLYYSESCVPFENKEDSEDHTHHLRHSISSIESLWNKFESALDEQYETISKHRMSVDLYIKNKI